jgi:hypothetical protein
LLVYFKRDKEQLDSAIMRITQLNILFVFLISMSITNPIHYIPLEDIKWIDWIDPQNIFKLQYPSLEFWKIIKENQNISNLSYNLPDIYKDVHYVDSYYDKYDIAILHMENGGANVKITVDTIPIKDISNRYGFPVFKNYSSYPNALVENFEEYGKINFPKYQTVEKHSDKYLISENKASGILARYSSSLGNSYGMLILYTIDKNHEIVLIYKYIAEANAFMTYLPVAEKILDSIKIL